MGKSEKRRARDEQRKGENRRRTALEDNLKGDAVVSALEGVMAALFSCIVVVVQFPLRIVSRLYDAVGQATL